MTLAFNEYFWDDWLGVGPPAPASSDDEDTDGTTHGKRQRPLKQYIQADPFFWDAREAYLQSLVKQSISEKPPIPVATEEPPAASKRAPPVRLSIEEPIPQLVANRAALLSSIRAAETTSNLKKQGERFAALNRKIAITQQLARTTAAAEQSAREEAEFAARSTARQAQLSQLRSAVRSRLRKLTQLRSS